MVQLENMPDYLRETGRKACSMIKDNIPVELAELNRWVKRTAQKHGGPGWNTPENWKELEEIEGEAMFVMTDTDYLVIDADHVADENGILYPEVKAAFIRIIDAGQGLKTYIERSLSSRGRHMVYDLSEYADAFSPLSNRKELLITFPEHPEAKIELWYHVGHSFYFTGDTVKASGADVIGGDAAAGVMRELLQMIAECREGSRAAAPGAPAHPVPESEQVRVMNALRAIPCEKLTYEEWLHVGMALYNSGAPFEIFDQWSATDAARYNVDRVNTTENKWKSFQSGAGNWNAGTIFKMAKAYGWRDAAEDFAEDPEENRSTLPEPETFTAETLQNLPELRPSIIEGLLRAGHKMMIAGPSKAGKSFSMIELALAFAAGNEWLGFQCKRCRVLYCNLEVDGDSFKHRIAAIMEKLEISPAEIGDRLKLWNLRGKAAELSTMLSTFKEQARGCDVLILDPIYKIMEGDENSASEMGKFTRNLDRLAEEGAAIIYAHHFGKATQKAYDDPMNRASGSGVFARDPDAILTMSALNMEYVTQEQRQTAGVTSRASGFQLDFTLREFAPHSPFKIWFDYPVHIEDNGALDGTTITGKSASSIDRAARCIAVLSKVFDDFKNEIEEDGGIDLRFLDGRVGSIGGKNKKNIGEKTIRRYAEDSRKYFYVKNGKLYRGTDFHNPEEATPFDTYDF